MTDEDSDLESTGPQRTLAEVFVQQYEVAQQDGDYSPIDFYEGDQDWFDPDGIADITLASYSWADDYRPDGDMRPLGDGWGAVIGFPDGSAVTIYGGDDGSPPAVWDLPIAADARARAIEQWEADHTLPDEDEDDEDA